MSYKHDEWVRRVDYDLDTAEVALEIIAKSKEVLKWIKKQ